MSVWTPERRARHSERLKEAWRKRKERERRLREPHLHVFYGHAARSSEPDERCMYCGRVFAVMAYTYFGAPVCGYCWDQRWRKSDDGEADPPFRRIAHQVAGEWAGDQ